jgi:sterol desaturase/sphingolipid hydroxylase (fatty acid hydroxylase superfamily)
MTFSTLIIEQESSIRLGFFLGVLTVMIGWELAAPARPYTVPKAIRWTNNLGLTAFNTLLLRLIFPVAAVGVAVFASSKGWGILNNVQLPFPVAVALSVIALDFVVYLQHVLVHIIPPLWRIHRVHHADLDYDVTTGSRFHPLEIILSMLIKFLFILALGAPAVAVVLFEVILNATSMFNHGNVRLPLAIDRILRVFIVTPDMHRVHHSIDVRETNSNFGFNLSVWDRLFGTYIDQPSDGHDRMTIGIPDFRNPRQVSRLPGMLTLPFKEASEAKEV